MSFGCGMCVNPGNVSKILDSSFTTSLGRSASKAVHPPLLYSYSRKQPCFWDEEA